MLWFSEFTILLAMQLFSLELERSDSGSKRSTFLDYLMPFAGSVSQQNFQLQIF